MACGQEQGGDHKAHDTQLHSPTHTSSGHKNKPETQGVTTRSAESHSHGGAVLSIAAENNAIVMELGTPLYNLLGFEYAPKTPEEKARVSEVEARLTQPETLIRFNPEAGCTYDKPLKSVALFDEHAHHGDGEAHGSDHKDVILQYGLRCNSIDKLQKLDARLFEAFPFFTELELVYLGPSLQMSAELSSARPTADLTR